ncbi:helix-turn-helix domain-containing protein [Streptococcus suis]|uniref:response regulator transcription factor n=1 Tax=Streptococcus suis TaxID=1307 RepID=UPI0038BA0B51
MKILLVDDDSYIIQALNEKINWEEFGVDQVFSAYSMRQAQNFFKETEIDLLISDIEMPQGSGLELLAWIRQENYSTQAIFLTNYADFNYAQKAIELQSFEYYLKPIDYEKFGLIIQKAIAKIRKKKQEAKNLPVNEEIFWFEYLRKPASHDDKLFLEDALSKNISNNGLQPIILTLQLSYENNQEITLSWTRQLTQAIQSFTNIHTHYHLATSIKIPQYAERYLFLFKSVNNLQKSEFFSELQVYLTEKFNQPIQILLGKHSNLESILTNTQSLYNFSYEYIGHQNAIYTIDNKTDIRYSDISMLPADSTLLSYNKLSSFLFEQYPSLKNNRLFPTSWLKRMQLDILQKISVILDQKGISAHKLFQTKMHDYYQERCFNSIEDWLKYIEFYSNTAGDYIKLLESQQSLSQIIIDYIDHHYSEELNRKVLADLVFISPDHLARLFKHETGKTLINYITDKRIEEAKKLLLNSNATVYIIADQVGYDNYSYFSKSFKKNTGLSPIEFRQQYSVYGV